MIIFLRTWKQNCLQPLSSTGYAIQMSENNSDVILSAISADKISNQNVVFIGGKIWNQNLNKFLSLNLGTVKADSNDTRGASSWKIGLCTFC